MEIKNPAEEMPVNNKESLSLFLIFSFIVKNISITPKREKTIKGAKKRIEPLSKSLTAGINNSIKTKTKTINNAKNIANKYFLWNIEFWFGDLSDVCF